MKDTKEALVTTALKLFAQRGLDGVTVREICRASRVNIAMVNYHFGNKEGLYAACVARVFAPEGSISLSRLDENVHDEQSWREAVRSWVTGFSQAMHAHEGPLSRVSGLFRQEVVNASTMHKFIQSHYAQPALDCLLRLLSMAVDDSKECFCWATAIWAQLSAYAVVDVRWQPMFRPEGTTPEDWGKVFAEFVCSHIFAELKYRIPAEKERI